MRKRGREEREDIHQERERDREKEGKEKDDKRKSHTCTTCKYSCTCMVTMHVILKKMLMAT